MVLTSSIRTINSVVQPLLTKTPDEVAASLALVMGVTVIKAVTTSMTILMGLILGLQAQCLTVVEEI